MSLAYIAAGSNMGNRLQYLEQARASLSTTQSVHFLRASKIYETEPVGGPVQGKFLNAVWELETGLSPEALLTALLSIEKKLGRIRTEANGPRTVDLDILFYGDQVIDTPGLRIPHARLQSREFVLLPLMDLCPDKIHPQSKKTIRTLWQELQGNS